MTMLLGKGKSVGWVKEQAKATAEADSSATLRNDKQKGGTAAIYLLRSLAFLDAPNAHVPIMV
jgi:hypothetical protein